MARISSIGSAWLMVALVATLATTTLFAAQVVQATSRETRAQPAFGKRYPFGTLHFVPRDITSSGDTFNGQTYDYVIVGGGLAGLTVAGRLSEDSDVTVLVIEAGGDIYAGDNKRFLTPSANLYDSSVGTDADWQWETTPQKGLGGRTTPWPRGKVLGGSSSVNGLYMVRASEIEHNAWGDLNNARDTWGWDAMLAAMKKSERFHPPTDSVKETVPSLQFNQASHGTNGPVSVGWSAVSYPAVEGFLQASANEGTPISTDPDSGKSWGSFLATSAINADNWQRSSSRTAYINDTVRARSNLHVLTNNQVTQVLTSKADGGNIKATGVEYATGDGEQRKTVKASREVILSGGAINSPQLLQLSGIGDAQQLQKLGIPSVIDLPGVGHNVQDHLSTAVTFSPSQGAQMPPASVTGDAKTDSYVNSAISYVNVKTLFGDYSAQLLDQLRANLTQVINTAPVRDEVKAAYNMTYSAQVNDVFASPVGPVEILFALTFGQVQVQVALQHPLSRGSILINDKNPFASPLIDAGYLTQNIDLMMLREGAKLARRIGINGAMRQYVGGELTPGSGVQSDDQWDDYVRNTGRTEYHPSSGCSMLPRENGGVVDPNMLVYGTSNLRVIDSSVPPLAVSAHLMTITYGLAEIGADLVKKARLAPAQSATATSKSSQSAGKTVDTASPVRTKSGASTATDTTSFQSSGANSVVKKAGCHIVGGFAALTVASMLLL